MAGFVGVSRANNANNSVSFSSSKVLKNIKHREIKLLLLNAKTFHKIPSCELYYTKIGLSKTVMKRYGLLFEKVCSIENIENAVDNVLKHSNLKKAKKYLIDHREEIVKLIHHQLQTETYKFSSLREFIVYEPKERIIHCPSKILDKVVHHCLMNVCTPLFYKKFTRDSYGCIKGRGIVTAISVLLKLLKHYLITTFYKLI